MPSEFFQTFLGNAKHIRHWLISYRDHAYPNEQEMKKIIGSLGKQEPDEDPRTTITPSPPGTARPRTPRNGCSSATPAQQPRRSKTVKPVPLAAAANFHTSIPVEIRLREAGTLSAEAMDVGPAGDPQFSFMLCRTGTNRNGDHFTRRGTLRTRT